MLEVIALFIIILLIILILKYRGEVEKLKAGLESIATQRAREIYESWRSSELAQVKSSLEEVLRREYEAKFQQWKAEEEERIRRDAIERSKATILGKVGEHLAPILLIANYGAEPDEIRFLGSPIDYIVFKGLSRGGPCEILFVELKSGKTTTLTEREKTIKEAVDSHKVKWLTLHLPSELAKPEKPT